MKDRIKAQSCSQKFRRLADPERLKIIQCLQAGPHSVGALAQALGTELANVSHHLKVLSGAGFLNRKKRGKNVIYSLNPEIFSEQKKQDVLNFGCCQIVLPGHQK